MTDVTTRPIDWRTMGDRALTAVLGDTLCAPVQARVAAFDRRVLAAQRAGALPGLTETVPAFCSLTFLFDPCRTSRETLQAALTALLNAPHAEGMPADSRAESRHWSLPVCHDEAFAPDLDWLADGLAGAARGDRDALIALYGSCRVTVHTLGFLPGFAFMGDIDPALRRPRRDTPRTAVPAGSVAVANQLTAIYPGESPGGWHLLGRCPVRLFDPLADPPALLAPGDTVRMSAVSRRQFDDIAAEQATGARWQPE